MQYEPVLNLIETEVAIKFIKDKFEKELAKALDLTRVSAPLFVFPETGLNDNLNGYERAVRFDVFSLGREVEIVQSLAKWKRMALAKYGFKTETGLYTDMNAIRRDEVLDELHSVYVDQWDWEKIISREERKYSYLKKVVKKIYGAIRKLSSSVNRRYPALKQNLPKNITFISTKQLEHEYPDLTRKERENVVAKKYGAVFVSQIGWNLEDGSPHDGRAADYDDWKLNGDIILYNSVLDTAFEVSSMGIRVDENSLVKQLKVKNELYKLENEYCKSLLCGDLPLTIGGGIGQSRLCMYFLKKAHIGEVQSSVWSEEQIKKCAENGVNLL